MDINQSDDDTCSAHGDFVKCVQAIVADVKRIYINIL